MGSKPLKYDFKGLLEDTTAAGTVRWRVRVEGRPDKKIRIPVGPGEPGFHDHYLAARAGQKLEIVKPRHAKAGTLDALCDAFFRWMEEEVSAGNLSPLTLSSRRTGLSQACDTKDPDGDRVGSLDADLPREAFVYIRDSYGRRTGAAATCLKALRAAYKWGEDRGYPKKSPIFDVKSGHKAKGGAIAWTSGDVEKFLRAHGPGTMARLWFSLAYDSHGRIGDMHRLGPANDVMHENDRYLEWQPSKRGSEFVSLPFGDMLAAELEFHEERETYLVTEHGRPFASSGSLDNRVRKWIIGAGLCVDAKDELGNPIYVGTGKRKEVKKTATRSQHGLRKGVAELMAERGATEYELMASFGWTEAKTASVYTKKFRRRAAASVASQRVEISKGGPRPKIRGPLSGPSAGKIEEKSWIWQPVGESNPSFQVENLAS